MMNRIILAVEGAGLGHRSADLADPARPSEVQDALGRAASVLAERMNAAAIITVTHSGRTATVASRYRPRVPIIAVTDSMQTLQRLSIVWGVRGVVLEEEERDVDGAIRAIERQLVQSALVNPGDSLVLLAGQPFFAGGATNFIRVEKVSRQ
jgi:pyruvate kinase